MQTDPCLVVVVVVVVLLHGLAAHLCVCVAGAGKSMTDSAKGLSWQLPLEAPSFAEAVQMHFEPCRIFGVALLKPLHTAMSICMHAMTITEHGWRCRGIYSWPCLQPHACMLPTLPALPFINRNVYALCGSVQARKLGTEQPKLGSQSCACSLTARVQGWLELALCP